MPPPDIESGGGVFVSSAPGSEKSRPGPGDPENAGGSLTGSERIPADRATAFRNGHGSRLLLRSLWGQEPARAADAVSRRLKSDWDIEHGRSRGGVQDSECNNGH